MNVRAARFIRGGCTVVLVVIAGVLGFYSVVHRIPGLARMVDFLNGRLPAWPERLPFPTPDPLRRAEVGP